jgi:methionine synthase II (cobalamin-independent)
VSTQPTLRPNDPALATAHTDDVGAPAFEPGSATGIGSWPGVEVLEIARLTFGELGEPPSLPYLPELPGRGPGADLVGRGAVLLVDLPVDLQPSGWRLVDHAGRDLNRARSFLRQDLDVLAEVADGYTGRLKLQVTGPWTLASALWLPRLERAVVDPGAVRDLIASLAEGVLRHVSEVSALLPGVEIVLQVDEPGLRAVLDGSLPTASGFGRLRAVEEPVVVDGLRTVLEAATAAGARTTVIHTCVADPPIDLLVRTGAAAVSVDVQQLSSARWESVAAAVETGVGFWAGAVPTPSAATPIPRPDTVADAIWRPWRQLGLAAETASAVVVTPACGLAGVSPQLARAAVRAAKAGALVLAERALS